MNFRDPDEAAQMARIFQSLHYLDVEGGEERTNADGVTTYTPRPVTRTLSEAETEALLRELGITDDDPETVESIHARIGYVEADEPYEESSPWWKRLGRWIMSLLT